MPYADYRDKQDNMKIYYERNKDRLLEERKEWYNRNRDLILQGKKERYKIMKYLIIQAQKEYQNKPGVKEHIRNRNKLYYDIVNLRRREKYHNDSEYREQRKQLMRLSYIKHRDKRLAQKRTPEARKRNAKRMVLYRLRNKIFNMFKENKKG